MELLRPAHVGVIEVCGVQQTGGMEQGKKTVISVLREALH